MDIIFDITNQKLERRDKNFIVADSKNYLYARFNFTDDWDNKNKTAVFKNDTNIFNVILENNRCLIPHEVIKKGWFNVSVFAGDLITANSVVISVAESGLIDGGTPLPPTPNIYNTILNIANEAKTIAQSIESRANQGEFNGSDGQDGKGIAEILKTGTEGNIDTYTIYYTDGTTSTFEIVNGTGIPKQDLIWTQNSLVLSNGTFSTDTARKLTEEEMIEMFGMPSNVPAQVWLIGKDYHQWVVFCLYEDYEDEYESIPRGAVVVYPLFGRENGAETIININEKETSIAIIFERPVSNIMASIYPEQRYSWNDLTEQWEQDNNGTHLKYWDYEETIYALIDPDKRYTRWIQNDNGNCYRIEQNIDVHLELNYSTRYRREWNQSTEQWNYYNDENGEYIRHPYTGEYETILSNKRYDLIEDEMNYIKDSTGEQLKLTIFEGGDNWILSGFEYGN
jgi:hypothetical protein